MTGPGIEPQTSRTDSLRLATELTAGFAVVALKPNFNSFTVIRKCNTAYEAKMQETLLIKERNPKLKKQLYANRESFLLNIY